MMQCGFITLHCLVKKKYHFPRDVCSAHEALKSGQYSSVRSFFGLEIKRERVSEISALRIHVALKQCNKNKNKTASPQGFFLCFFLAEFHLGWCDRKTESCIELVQYILSSLTPVQSRCSPHT